MSAYVIYEETHEVLYFKNGLPYAGNYPTYTYGYEIETQTWYRAHKLSMAKGSDWIELDPHDPQEVIPKNIQTIVLLMGG